MKIRQLTVFLFLYACLAFSITAIAGEDEERLTGLLTAFLDGASRNDAVMHDRFWAEDLVYTSSSGERFGKSNIMDGMSEAGEPDPNPPLMVYSAEEVRIQLYGDTAIVAFRLLGTPSDATEDVLQFFNTGTFLKRKGEWRAVAWQATRIP